MATLQSLKSRIESITKTASITKAMYQIASSKLVTAQNAYEKYYEFKDAFDDILSDVFNVEENNLFLETVNRSEHKLFILISGDRGLVGGYHVQLFKNFLEHIQKFNKEHVHVITIGRRAYTFADKQKLNRINKEIIFNHDDIDESILIDYMKNIVKLYVDNFYGEISVFSNKFINSMTYIAENEVLLPLKLKPVKEKKPYDSYHYEGSKMDNIKDLIMLYVQSRLYGTIVDAKLSEYTSRIMAMKNATDNATDALEKLNLKYHQARQQKITNELLDISNAKL